MAAKCSAQRWWWSSFDIGNGQPTRCFFSFSLSFCLHKHVCTPIPLAHDSMNEKEDGEGIKLNETEKWFLNWRGKWLWMWAKWENGIPNERPTAKYTCACYMSAQRIQIGTDTHFRIFRECQPHLARMQSVSWYSNDWPKVMVVNRVARTKPTEEEMGKE